MRIADIEFTVLPDDITILSGFKSAVAGGISRSASEDVTFTFSVLPDGVSGASLNSGVIKDWTGIDQLTVDNGRLKACVQGGILYVSGLTVGVEWRVYNIMGALIHHNVANANETTLPLPVRGIYIVTDGKNVVKLINY